MTGLPATGIQGEPEIGVLLPTSEPAVFEHNAPLQQLTRIARRAEDLGFDSLWAGESLQSPRFEPLAVLAVAAAATGRVRLGTASMIPAYRQPVATAQQIATLDRLTEGRLVLGVGAGYPMPRTQAALELASVDYRRRVTLLDDIAALWRAMWGTGATDFDGKLLHLRDLPPARAHTSAGPGLWLASATDAALARAGAVYDGWLPYPTDPAVYAAGWERVLAVSTSALRSAGEVTPALFATVLVTDDAEQAHRELDAFCQATYGLPAAVVGSIQVLIVGDGREVARRLAEYVEAGARHLVLRVGSLDLGDQLERLAEALAPLRATAPS